jgi:hypothetical protein
VRGHFLSVLERAAIGEIGGDPGRAERVATDFGRDAGRLGAAEAAARLLETWSIRRPKIPSQDCATGRSCQSVCKLDSAAPKIGALKVGDLHQNRGYDSLRVMRKAAAATRWRSTGRRPRDRAQSGVIPGDQKAFIALRPDAAAKQFGKALQHLGRGRCPLRRHQALHREVEQRMATSPVWLDRRRGERRPRGKEGPTAVSPFWARPDAARAAASIALMTPGLSVIIAAIKESRKIFKRMNSYAIYRIAETPRVLLFMTVAILIFNFYRLTAV